MGAPPSSRKGGATTGSMQAYETANVDIAEGLRPAAGQGTDRAGLVLMYAPSFERLLPAYPLERAEMILGREAPADIVLPLPAVSRRHARLHHDGSAWVITDLGARNGTLVGGVFISEQRLRHLDEIRIGDSFFKFVSWGAQSFLPYRIDGAVLGGAYACPQGIVGGYQMAAVAHALERIAKSAISVVLLGESGTGKEVFARQVHAWSGRQGAFCALNCAAIPATLLESELFGYRRGAFSGAERDHVGLVRAADGGTLFLDEIGDMPLEAQAKLLRVLQTREVMPLGATHPEHVDVRFVSATHRDLATMQLEGRFRVDLFARLNEYSVMLPPLRQRKEDVYALCLEFLRLHKRPDLQLTVPYLTGLLHHPFPYNVRELEALIKRAIALADGSKLEARHLSAEVHETMRGYGRRASQGEPISGERRPASARPPAPSWNADELTQIAEIDPASLARAAERAAASEMPSEDELRRVLTACEGNIAAVGRHYGKERMQVHRWMKRYNIDPNDYRMR